MNDGIIQTNGLKIWKISYMLQLKYYLYSHSINKYQFSILLFIFNFLEFIYTKNMIFLIFKTLKIIIINNYLFNEIKHGL